MKQPHEARMTLVWTKDRVAKLKHLLNAGFSASQIAIELEVVSRNAVLGCVFRLGLSEKRAPFTPGTKLEKARARAKRYTLKKKQQRWAVNPSLEEAAERLKQKKDVRASFESKGTTRTSIAYRRHMPRAPDMTKSELRAMLTAAIIQTAGM